MYCANFITTLPPMRQQKLTPLLLHWHRHHNERIMPWKGEKDPYKIWLSEIILQQTRVEQGWAYYERFLKQYPSLPDLAHATDEAVFKLWEGLGYYSRCKNLLRTARFVLQEYGGQFPADYTALLGMKGIGPYTAAAIASFAFQLPYAVVDGNVFRVLARVFGIDTPTDSTKGKKVFTQLAQEVLCKQHPDLFNQAIMDLGATVCKPILPLCRSCPLQPICKAHHEGTVYQLPVKEKILLKKKRRFYYFLLEQNGKVWIHKRTRKDIWENLYELFLVESAEEIEWTEKQVQQWLHEQWGVKDYTLLQVSGKETQQLTHQQISGRLIHVRFKKALPALQQYETIALAQLAEKPFPKFIHQLMKNAGIW